MRILHTSDWHLGSAYDRFDRTAELFEQVKRVCRICQEQNVNVLLIAGDVFNCKNRKRQHLHEVTKELSGILSSHIRDGLRVIMIPGNHDDRDHFRVMKALLELEQGCAGCVHVVQGCDIFEIDGVQFAAIPYPDRELLEKAGESTSAASKTGKSERNQSLSVNLADLVRDVTERLDPARPSVFVTHIQIYGVKTPSERELTYKEDICLSRESLPTNVSYIALGHIHQRQRIEHVVPCWYSGSFDRMDLGEREDKKYVLLVDVTDSGPAKVTEYQIETTPFAEINVSSDDLESCAESYAERERAYVRLNIECALGANRIALQRRARELFPRWIEVNPKGNDPSSVAANAPANPKDVKKTVMDYLEERFADDPDLPELKQRGEMLIQEVNDALTAN